MSDIAQALILTLRSRRPALVRSGIHAFVSLLLVGCMTQPTRLPPSEIYGELFHDVQTQDVFADSKTFVDALPERSPG